MLKHTFVLIALISSNLFSQVHNLDTVYVYSEDPVASNEMRNKAKSDIAKGNVYIYLYGYYSLKGPKSDLDSITHKYGFEYKFAGCTRWPGAKAYEDEVMKYLNKRNAEGWWEKYLQEASTLNK